MSQLVYSAITSLDGYVADESGGFEWAAPDDEVHAFVNNCERSIGTYLYGRRMYDVMVAWETMPTDEAPAVVQEYATIWRAADKIVYSTTLETVASARTRLEQEFDPTVVRQLKTSAASDISVGGPGLAAHAIRAGLVDVINLFVTPVVVGGGTRALPDGGRLDLELLEENRFSSGVVQLQYRFG